MATPVAMKDQGQGPQKQVAVPISTGELLAGLSREVQESVGRRAYDYYEARGRAHGQDLADWFRAESELVPLREQISELKDELRVEVSLEGLGSADLHLGVDRRHLVVTASRKEGEPSPGRRVILAAKMIDLPAEVDPARATATSEGTTLTINLPRAGASPV